MSGTHLAVSLDGHRAVAKLRDASTVVTVEAK